MKSLSRIVLSVCLSWVLCLPAYAAQKVYSVGVVPQFQARKLHAIWQPILQSLESATGEKFVLKGSPSIPEFEREFMRGGFDFAYMNPYHLIIANAEAGYTPVVRDHGRKLFGVLVVNNNSDISSAKDLDGKTLAFPAPNALGASLQMRQELVDKFGIDFTPLFVKTHDSVYLNVILGKVAAGGGVQKTLKRQKEQYRSRLRVIHETDKVNPHPLAALPSVPEEVRRKVVNAFLALGETEDGKAMLAKIPMRQVGKATLQDYQALTKMGLERFYVAP